MVRRRKTQILGPKRMVRVVDIFDEVSEDLRADRARALFTRYGGVLAGACLLALAGVAGWQYYQSRAQAEDRRVSSLFLAATTQAAAVTDDASRTAAEAAFQNVEKQGHSGYTPLARMDEATLKFAGGDHTGALALWDLVSKEANTPQAIRDLATLMWISHQTDHGDVSLLTARLQPLLSVNNMWHGLASEQMALILLRQGQTAQARQRLQALQSDNTAPQGARSRAAGLLSSIGG